MGDLNSLRREAIHFEAIEAPTNNRRPVENSRHFFKSPYDIWGASVAIHVSPLQANQAYTEEAA